MGSFDPNMKQSERAALVGNELDSALASAIDNFRDVRTDLIWTDDEVREEANVIRLLDEILDEWKNIAPYIL
jgi:hypothetical protein